MAEAANAKKKPKSVGVQTYARARIFFKDRESLKRSVEIKTADETSNGKGLLTVLAGEEDTFKSLKTEFTNCFPGVANNEYCFDRVCRPLIANCMKGFKALLIAYGQTGSGKTFTMIGAKGAGQMGLLPRTLKEFVENKDVVEVRMKGFEAYSTTLQKIPIYDLFDPVNKFTCAPFKPPGCDVKENKKAEYLWVQKKSMAAKSLWGSKSGGTGTDTMKEGHSRVIESVDDAFNLVEEAHDASHFAKTGKNPESSRGHTVYVVVLKIRNPKGEDYSPVQTEFVCVDLAGSEGGSTLEKLPDGPDKTARFLEGGVINYGLSSLKDMFAEMRRKGKLKKTQGVGLRKLLYPFVTSNTMMSIIFTLSPSADNIMATRATMKFARDACKLKMKPVADTGRKNWEKMYHKLKALLDGKEELLKQYEENLEQAETIMAEAIQDTEFDHLTMTLQQLYRDRTQAVDHMFKEYGVDKYLPEEFNDEIDNAMAQTRLAYVARISELFEDAEVKERPDPEKLVEMQIELGNNLEVWFTKFEEEFKANVLQKNSASTDYMVNMANLSPRSSSTLRGISPRTPDIPSVSSMSSTMSRKHRRKVTEDWKSHTMILKQNKQTMEKRTTRTIRTLDSLFADDQSGAFTPLNAFSDDGGLDGIVEDELSEIESAVEYCEQYDLTQVPTWYIELHASVQDSLQDLIERNLFQGAISEEIQAQLTTEFGISDDQIDELVVFFLMKQGEDHDQDVIFNFHEEMGITADDEPYKGMDKVIDMQRRLIEIETHLSIEGGGSSEREPLPAEATSDQNMDPQLDIIMDEDEELPSTVQPGARLPSSIRSLDVFLNNSKTVDRGDDAPKKSNKRKFMFQTEPEHVQKIRREFETKMKKARQKSEMIKHPSKNNYTSSDSSLDWWTKHESLLGESKFSTLNTSELARFTFRELRMYAKEKGLKIGFGVTKSKLIRAIIDENMTQLKKKVDSLENAQDSSDMLDDPLLKVIPAAENILQKTDDSIILSFGLDNKDFALLLKEAWAIRDALGSPALE